MEIAGSGAMEAMHSAIADPIRVMVCDDSAVVRGLVTRMLEGDPEIKVVASVGNGQMALNSLGRYDVEVIVLDIEMPIMDGMTALPKLLAADANVQVIMASTLTSKNADITLKAMEAGAADYVAKPTSSREIGSQAFQRELIGKVKAWGAVRRKKAGGPAGHGIRKPAHTPFRAQAQAVQAAVARPLTTTTTTFRPPTPAPGQGSTTIPGYLKPSACTLRDAATEAPDLLAIGSSTGGPQALFKVLGDLGAGFNKVPILITQHMPATFTTILAEHISRISGLPCAEGKDGEAIRAGQIYVAPGDFHMIVESKGTEKIIRLTKTPPENFCRPSVDPMLRSLSKIYGRRLLVVILTGMGSDGMKGSQQVVGDGGTVVAQDEASSVVWGMPGAVATAGLCSALLPLNDVAPYIRKMVTRR